MDIIYDHEAEHSILDVPKHSFSGCLDPPEFFLSPFVKSSPLNSENPTTSLDGHFFCKFTHFCISHNKKYIQIIETLVLMSCSAVCVAGLFSSVTSAVLPSVCMKLLC